MFVKQRIFLVQWWDSSEYVLPKWVLFCVLSGLLV
jgi:hypothetical protein